MYNEYKAQIGMCYIRFEELNKICFCNVKIVFRNKIM